ncbi:MAG TPA: hypothetical protein VD713_07085, partial [Sphingomonadales bacterium]|nr:hypothetical protein [Sphingomonadales bacterium]
YSDTVNGEQRHILSLVDRHQLTKIVEKIWDPSEFLSDYGMRSLSKFHEQHPFVFGASTVRYEPAEADVKIKGGNSNWRGPIWFPTSYLITRSLLKYMEAFGSELKISPPGGEPPATLEQMAEEIANRMIRMFARNEEGRRPVYGGMEKFQNDPHWRDYLLFNEYFHGDNGAGLGANHQTGWSGLIANLIDEWRR